jgi:hypothetical protein
MSTWISVSRFVESMVIATACLACRTPIAPASYPTLDSLTCRRTADDPAVDRAAAHATVCVPFDMLEQTPIVRATIGGHAALLVVDTGGVTHLFTRTLTDALAAPVRELLFLDVHGIPAGIVANLDIELGGTWRVPHGNALVAQFPPLVDLQVDGLIVPQLLADDDHPVVFDASGHRMFVVDRATAATLERDDRIAASIMDEPIVASDVLGVEGVRQGLVGTRYLVPVKINGHDARLVLDTGSRRTHVGRDAPGVVAGTGADGSTASVELEVGRVTASGAFDVRRLESDRYPADGLLGMDVLSRCTLVLYTHHAFARCPLA